jgi:hypothetical protein
VNLALRTGARSAVCDCSGATDCRFVMVETRGVGFWLAGRALGAAAVEVALVVVAMEGAFGCGVVMTRRMLVSLTNRPWAGGHSKYLSPRTEPSFGNGWKDRWKDGGRMGSDSRMIGGMMVEEWVGRMVE